MNRPELTFEEFCLLPMQYTMGMRFDTSAQRMYRNEEVGMQEEVITPFNPHRQTWGIGDTSYFLDGDDREFKTVAELYMAYMHKACGVPETIPQPLNQGDTK